VFPDYRGPLARQWWEIKGRPMKWSQFFRWQSRKQGALKPLGRNARRSRPEPRRCRLVLEPLEDRILLSVANLPSLVQSPASPIANTMNAVGATPKASISYQGGY